MVNFDIEKKGYNKEQVEKYFEIVKTEYQKVYSENEALREQVQQLQQELRQAASRDTGYEKAEAISKALIDAEVEAQRIIDNAREQAWRIITDAKKGATENPVPLMVGMKKLPALDWKQMILDDVDRQIADMLKEAEMW